MLIPLERPTIQAHDLNQPPSRNAVGIGSSAELEKLLRLHPRLRRLLYDIYTATLGLPTGEPVDHDQGSGEHVYRRAKGRIQRPHAAPPWSQQRRLENGLYALRKLRGKTTIDSDALRAFSDLVTKGVTGTNIG